MLGVCRLPPTKSELKTHLLSWLLTASRNSRSFSSLAVSSPKLTMSQATLFFLSLLPSLTRSAAEVLSSGDPTRAMMRWRRFLF